MSDNYINEESVWPPTIDKFVSLRDDASGRYQEDSIVNAKHFNKLANFINKFQSLFSASSSGSTGGDGTYNGMPHYIEANCIVSDIVKGHANNAWNTTLTVNFPGNVLPFEIIITKRQDNYAGWLTLLDGAPGWQLFQDNASGAALNKWSGTSFFDARVMVVPTISSSRQTDSSGSDIVGTFLDCKHLICTCHTQQSSDSIRIRGVLTDIGITSGDSDWTQSNRWNTLGQYVKLSLGITIIK